MNNCSDKIFALEKGLYTMRKISKVLKSPKQKRSKDTFEIILEASVQILMKGDFKDFNTRKIAERAGVSPGTIYQYFPNKEAIFRELCLKQFDEDILGLESLIEYRPKKNEVRFFVEEIFKTTDEELLISQIIYERIGTYLSSKEISVREKRISEILLEYFDGKSSVTFDVMYSAFMGILYNRESLLKRYSEKEVKREIIQLVDKIRGSKGI